MDDYIILTIIIEDGSCPSSIALQHDSHPSMDSFESLASPLRRQGTLGEKVER